MHTSIYPAILRWTDISMGIPPARQLVPFLHLTPEYIPSLKKDNKARSDGTGTSSHGDFSSLSLRKTWKNYMWIIFFAN